MTTSPLTTTPVRPAGPAPASTTVDRLGRRRALRSRLHRPLRSEVLLFGGTALSVLLLLALAWPQMNVSLWLDEATSLVYVRAPLHPFIQVVTGPELNQVLYYVLLRPWAAVVHSPAAVRVPSLIFSVLTVIAAADVGRRLFALLPWPARRLAPLAGAVAALAAGTNGMVAAYGADARGYSLELLLVTASLAALLRLLARPRLITSLTWGILAGLAVYAHFFALLPLAAVGVALLALPRARVPGRLLGFGLIPIVLLVAPIAVYVVTDPGNTAWVGSPTTGRFTSALAVIAGGDAGGQQAGTLGVLVSEAAILVLAAAVICGAFDLVRSARSTGRSAETFSAALPLSLVLVPFGLALVAGFIEPVFFSRYLIVCVPGVVLLVATGVARRLTPDLRPLPADGGEPDPWQPGTSWEKATAAAATFGLLASVGLIGLGIVGSSRCTHDACVRENWSGAVLRISGRADPGDVVVVYQPDTVRAYIEAVDRLPAARRSKISHDVVWPQPGPYDPQGSRVQPPLLKTVAAAKPTRVWLVLSHVAASNVAAVAAKITRQLAGVYGAPTKKTFRGVEVLLFAKPVATTTTPATSTPAPTTTPLPTTTPSAAASAPATLEPTATPTPVASTAVAS